MFNMNSRVSDSPLDAPRDFAEYCRQVKAKFRATLACVQKLKASVLVCPDVGCGVFENDPDVVGCLLGEAILEYPGDLEVITTGKPAFFHAVKATVDAVPSLPLKETAPVPESFTRCLPKPKAKGKGKPPPKAPPTVYGAATPAPPDKAAPDSRPKAGTSHAEPKASTADPKAKAAAPDPKAAAPESKAKAAPKAKP
mmetsp:Transcript_18357/g.32090  ORF Transcript_18357/g.32090 Transcript_18357/m.32090 type:complete len:197 (+) Transcript_18357:1-591(+)